jgi:hypothetical protein
MVRRAVVAAGRLGSVDVELLRFTRSQLPLVEAWFADPDTQRWLGGPSWPRQMLDLADAPLGVFRGAVETGRYRWLGWEEGRPVGYIDCGVHERWTTWEGGPAGCGVLGEIPGPAGLRRPGQPAGSAPVRDGRIDSGVVARVEADEGEVVAGTEVLSLGVGHGRLVRPHVGLLDGEPRGVHQCAGWSAPVTSTVAPRGTDEPSWQG